MRHPTRVPRSVTLTRFDAGLIGLGITGVGALLLWVKHLEGCDEEEKGPWNWMGADYGPGWLRRRKIAGAWGFVAMGLLLRAIALASPA
jgi:hypothetical protein